MVFGHIEWNLGSFVPAWFKLVNVVNAETVSTTSEYIAKAIWESVLSTFGRVNTVLVLSNCQMTTDGARNMKAVPEKLKALLTEEGYATESVRMPHQHCVAHRLALAMKDTVKECSGDDSVLQEFDLTDFVECFMLGVMENDDLIGKEQEFQPKYMEGSKLLYFLEDLVAKTMTLKEYFRAIHDLAVILDRSPGKRDPLNKSAASLGVKKRVKLAPATRGTALSEQIVKLQDEEPKAAAQEVRRSPQSASEQRFRKN